MTIDRIHPSEAQLDAELELVTDYIMRTMTAEQAEKFEQDLRDDEEFFDRVAPILKVWYSRAPGYTMARTRERVRVRALTHAPAVAPIESQELPSPALVGHDPKVIPISDGRARAARRRQFRLHIVAAWSALSATAAGIAVLAVELVQSAGPVLVPAVATKTPRQQKPAAPAVQTPPTAVASAPRPHKRPSPTVTSPVVVAELPIVTAPADSAVTLDSLALARAMETRVDPEIDIRSPKVVQWVPPLGEPKRGMASDIAHALGDKIAGLWGKLRHPRTHKPAPPEPPK